MHHGVFQPLANPSNPAHTPSTAPDVPPHLVFRSTCYSNLTFLLSFPHNLHSQPTFSLLRQTQRPSSSSLPTQARWIQTDSPCQTFPHHACNIRIQMRLSSCFPALVIRICTSVA